MKTESVVAAPIGGINWSVSKADAALIGQIAKRALEMAARQGAKVKLQTYVMDLTACHANGMPLDLKKLLAADDFNLAYDVFGIYRHMNRETGKLEGFFVPRCSKH